MAIGVPRFWPCPLVGGTNEKCHHCAAISSQRTAVKSRTWVQSDKRGYSRLLTGNVNLSYAS